MHPQDIADWQRRPIRTCRTMHECQLCDADITVGQRYYDGGGFGCRAHVDCVVLHSGVPAAEAN